MEHSGTADVEESFEFHGYAYGIYVTARPTVEQLKALGFFAAHDQWNREIIIYELISNEARAQLRGEIG